MKQETDIRLNQYAPVPLYRQIADGVRQMIAIGKLRSGDRLPPVRQLAKSLNVNQNTVMRAYLELEHDRVVVSRKGGGTRVATGTSGNTIRISRQKMLSDMISDHILKVLSLNYSVDEIEAAFHLHLSRWREGKIMTNRVVKTTAQNTCDDPVVVSGSHDQALGLLIDLLKHETALIIEIHPTGSLGGLIDLQQKRAHLAGIHLMDINTGEYNFPYIKKVLPGTNPVVVHLAYRMQGLIYLPGNPKNIMSLHDLGRPEIIFANRQAGSGTRVLLDLKLQEINLASSDIKGYDREFSTHLAVGISIANGEADTGLGIMAAARSCGLEFLPLFRERYDLVIPESNYQDPRLIPLWELMNSRRFKDLVAEIGGYDTSETGQIKKIS